MFAPGPRGVREPDAEHTVHGDGTVFRPVIRQPRRRSAMTERQRALGATIGPRPATCPHFYGIAYTSLLAHVADHALRRLVADVHRRPPAGQSGEMGQGVNRICSLYGRPLDGEYLAAYVWDGAGRGIHASRIAQHTGAVLVRPLRADDEPKAFLLGTGQEPRDHAKSGPQIPSASSRHFVKCPRCGRIHRLFTSGGAICISAVDAEGGEHYEPLPRRLQVRDNKTGGFRHYLEVWLPCRQLRHPRVDLHSADDDGDLNRAERIHPHPQGDVACF